MKLIKNLVLVSIGVFALQGCSSTRRDIVSLPESVQREIGSTDVYIEECDKTIKADIESSNLTTYTGGGLLVALVDCAIMSHRENCANDAMVNLQKELEEFNFQEKFNNRLSNVLQNTQWLHVQRINTITGLNDEKHQDIFKRASTDGVLTSKFIYKLNPQFNVITGTLFVTLYPTGEKIKKLVKAENPLETPVLKFHIAATAALPKAGENIEENAKLWESNNGAELKGALANILDQVFKKLDSVLKNPGHLGTE